MLKSFPILSMIDETCQPPSGCEAKRRVWNSSLSRLKTSFAIGVFCIDWASSPDLSELAG